MEQSPPHQQEPILVHCTDIHLDHIDRPYDRRHSALDSFIGVLNHKELGKEKYLLITGDISNALFIVDHLKYLNKHISKEYKKILFVLGNHDFYRGGIHDVRNAVKELCIKHDRLVYLTDNQYCQVSEKTIVFGHDGWYDGGYANWFKKGVVVMNDYYLIKEFIGKTNIEIFNLMNQFANSAKFLITDFGGNLIENHPTVENFVFLTHVPPFPENAVYNGKISDEFWMPNFSSKHCGDALLSLASKYHSKNFVSLCGHSHGKATYMARPNLRSETGISDYGNPKCSIQIITI